MFNVLAELVITIQNLIKDGWSFEFREGESKFNNSKLIATKGDKVRYVYQRYQSVEGFLESLREEEHNEWVDRVIAWDGLCPNCKIKPAINVYSCKSCGWEL